MRAIIAAVVVLVGGGCGHTHQTASSCAGSVITLVGDEPLTCDVKPPQRIDILDVTIDDCDQMGGEYVLRSSDGRYACEGVDY